MSNLIARILIRTALQTNSMLPVARAFSSAGWAFQTSWSNVVYVYICLSVWMLTRVGEIVTAAHRDLWYCTHRLTSEPWSETKT